eukprot:scaffold3849_cov179-Amphora_coffeaeformis.AAC.12
MRCLLGTHLKNHVRATILLLREYLEGTKVPLPTTMSEPPLLPSVSVIPNVAEFCCPGPPTVYKDKIYFAASRNFGNDPIGRELFVFDPALGTTNLFLDIVPGPDESSPNDLTVFDDMLYFSSYTTGIWMTDGTIEGTILVANNTVLGNIDFGFLEFNGDLYATFDKDGSGDAGFIQISPQGNNDVVSDDEGEEDSSVEDPSPIRKKEKRSPKSRGTKEESSMKKRMGKRNVHSWH